MSYGDSRQAKEVSLREMCSDLWSSGGRVVVKDEPPVSLQFLSSMPSYDDQVRVCQISCLYP